jgi:anti-anti-sigma regulatory factor
MIEMRWQRTSSVATVRLCVCCSYSDTSIITVLKSVAKIRLLKTVNPSVCVLQPSVERVFTAA